MPVTDTAQALALTPRDSALHALNRLAYGPRPGDVESVARQGVMNWIDGQLAPDRIDDPVVAVRERRFKILEYDRTELAHLFLEARRERREAKRQRAQAGDYSMGGYRDSVGALHTAPLQSAGDPGSPDPALQTGRRLALEFQQLAVVRAALSERQLYEVMVDFWTNHFNVFFAKGADRFLTPSYIEETIRPHTLGTFEDLLIATAQSPAMLFYLDNWQSVRPGASPSFPRSWSSPPDPLSVPERGDAVSSPSPEGRGGQGVRTMQGGQGVRTEGGSEEVRRPRKPKGINENYARELLELHTLGVGGGYTQQDIIDVARIFTGWSIGRPQQGADFEYHDWAHDKGEKQVLGVKFPAGHGMDEGVRLLKLLAHHPATMGHVSRQLCQRFVNDDPPDGCVDDAVAAWERSGGDVREVLRAIFHGADFWAAQNRRAKVKTPLEFVVSAVRAVEADPDTTPRLAQLVARLGQPLYLRVPPDAYPEKEEAWVNSGALLNRMNAAVALAAGRLPGVTSAVDPIIPATADREQLIAAIDEKLLYGSMSENTKTVIGRHISDIGDPLAARALAVGLAIGGPEFQRQ